MNVLLRIHNDLFTFLQSLISYSHRTEIDWLFHTADRHSAVLRSTQYHQIYVIFEDAYIISQGKATPQPVAYRGGRGLGCSTPPPPPPKFRRPSKIIPNSTRLWKLLKIAEFRTPTPQDVWKKGSKILKLPPVRNCFTLAMTNKLVVIINSLKVPKNKENITIWNEISCTKLQLPPEPLTRGATAPRSPSLCPLSSTEFVEHHPPPPEQNSWVHHWPQQASWTGPEGSRRLRPPDFKIRHTKIVWLSALRTCRLYSQVTFLLEADYIN